MEGWKQEPLQGWHSITNGHGQLQSPKHSPTAQCQTSLKAQRETEELSKQNEQQHST